MVQFCGQDVIIEKDFRTRGMSLNVNGNGQVAVKVGYLTKYSDDEIQCFIDKHKRFLRNQLADYSKVQLPDFNDGGKVCLLGKEYTVVRNEDVSSFAIEGNILKVPIRFSNLQTERFFGNLLFPHVKAMTELYAEVYGLSFSYVGLHTWYSAWGTHFREDDSIKYNVALIFVPEDCVEYVVAHELCHSLHHNHSEAFWAEVERIYPRYKESRTLLHSYSLDWLFERAKLGKWS